mgnify:CR=1 FL=1
MHSAGFSDRQRILQTLSRKLVDDNGIDLALYQSLYGLKTFIVTLYCIVAVLVGNGKTPRGSQLYADGQAGQIYFFSQSRFSASEAPSVSAAAVSVSVSEA